MVDERFVMHRYKATRLSVLVGVVLMLASITYGYIKTGEMRWDLFVIMSAMAAVKVGAMIYFRRTN